MPSSSSPAASNLHFLLIPLPEQGHINPMLCFASQLAALGCTVTFIKAEKAPLGTAQAVVPDQKGSRAAPEHSDSEAGHAASTHGSCVLLENGNISRSDACSANVRFGMLPYLGGPTPLTEASSRFEILKHTLGSLEERQEMVEKLVEESKASSAPISCVVCDILLCGWVMDMVKRQAVAAAALIPTAGVNFYLPFLMMSGNCEESEKLRQRFGLSEMTMPSNPEAMAKMAEVLRVFEKAFDHVDEASHVLLNSFEHLESALLPSLKVSELNVKFVGPCLPAWEAGGGLHEVNMAMFEHAGSMFTPVHTCLSWLDKQERSSVLYVSFGSEVTLEQEQVQELALGIEGSGYKFLWVVRPDAPTHNMPPEDFQKRTGSTGMFVSWAPQRKVLQHSSVGGFLTHCGWNSTLESMVSGMPMLCLPLNGDQFLNAQLIVSYWKVGLWLGPPRTLVPRAEVERAVQDLMKDNDLRERIQQLKEAAQCAISDSRVSIASFVQEIAKKAHKFTPSD